METEKDVHHEPTNVALSFPMVRPYNHKLQACAIDFSMVGTPEGAANATPSTNAQPDNSRNRRGACQNPVSNPELTNPPPTTPHPTPRQPHTKPDKPELDAAILKHHVIQNLHDNGISMIPATVGTFGDLGPMLEFLLYGTFPTDVNYTSLLSKHQVGVEHTKEMCLTAPQI
jgi:hypothetical protein